MHRHYHHRDRHEGFDNRLAYFAGHRQGRRFGSFSAGFVGGMGMGGGAFRAGRRLASGDLQLVLLALLAERASHGYELIKALQERSDGFYSPSPGMVYPALTWLEEMGYASVTCEGVKKLYSVTEAGRGWTTEQVRPYVERLLESFGPARLMFGSDWPVCTAEATFAEVVALAQDTLASLSEADADAFLSGTAHKAYALPRASAGA